MEIRVLDARIPPIAGTLMKVQQLAPRGKRGFRLFFDTPAERAAADSARFRILFALPEVPGPEVTDIQPQ